MEKHLQPILLQRYVDWSDASELVRRQMAVMKAWVKVGHYYRHGSPLEQIHEPPLDWALAVSAEGMAILRLLVVQDAPVTNQLHP